MRNKPLSVLAALALISLSMRFLAFSVVPERAAAESEVGTPATQKVRSRDERAAQDLTYLLSLNGLSSPVPVREKEARPDLRTVSCNLPSLPEFGGKTMPHRSSTKLEGKVRPYQSSTELRRDLDHTERWVNGLLVRPISRNGKPVGVMMTFKAPNPFIRLGFKSGDVLISLNDLKFSQIDDFPLLPTELTTAHSLHFLVERDGIRLPIHVEFPAEP